MAIIYANPAFYVFLATFTAFILLMLTTFSIPLVSTFYFLHTSQASGVSFGMWGWCLDDEVICSPTTFGYTWQPEISVPITKALVFYPITIIFVFFTMVAMMPVLCARNARSDKIFVVFAWLSFASSFISFLFMIGIYGVAKSRFEKRGFSARYGNLPWMSLAATILLLIASVAPYFYAPPPKQSSRRTNKNRDVESRSSRKRIESARHVAEQK